jgi:hypothetical protein
MTTTRDKEQTFARLFRMMDSSFEGEALSAFRQARRMLQEERATFGAILDHTHHLNETNRALDEQNRDLHRENERYRGRSAPLKRAVLARFGQLATWLPLTAAATLEDGEQRGARIANPPPWFRLSWKNIPQDLRTLLWIFGIVTVTTVSCHMLAFDHNADGAKSTSAGHGWLGRLPANFSVDHPPWCLYCNSHQDHSAVPPQDDKSSGAAR